MPNFSHGFISIAVFNQQYFWGNIFNSFAFTIEYAGNLTLTVCVGHVELAMLLLEMGANMEDSDDEVYTPIMEASRESHEEMAAGDCSDICRPAKKGYLYL